MLNTSLPCGCPSASKAKAFSIDPKDNNSSINLKSLDRMPSSQRSEKSNIVARIWWIDNKTAVRRDSNPRSDFEAQAAITCGSLDSHGERADSKSRAS